MFKSREEATAMEKKSRLRRSDLPHPIVGIICGVIGLFASIFINALFLLIFLLNGVILMPTEICFFLANPT
jgi:hypothetical protein